MTNVIEHDMNEIFLNGLASRMERTRYHGRTTESTDRYNTKVYIWEFDEEGREVLRRFGMRDVARITYTVFERSQFAENGTTEIINSKGDVTVWSHGSSSTILEYRDMELRAAIKQAAKVMDEGLM